MKIILCLLAVSALQLRAELFIIHHPPGPNVLNTSDFSVHPQSVVIDPWRIINGQVVKVDGSWLAVAGNITQVHLGAGIRLNGSIEGIEQAKDFFVINLPISGGEGDTVPPAGVVLLVKPAGTYTYSTRAGSTRTIRKYDYGSPCDEPQKTPEQIAAERKLAAKKKIEGAAATLKFNQEQSAKGDSYGQLRMGERYRDGDGVETNLYKARFLFMQSADQGNATASKELSKMTNAVPSR